MLIQKLKQILGFCEPGFEYWIPLKDIQVPSGFLHSRIEERKWVRKNNYYHQYGVFESQIVLDFNFTLIDGYSSYKIAKRYGMKKVPVVFAPASKVAEQQGGGYGIIYDRAEL